MAREKEKKVKKRLEVVGKMGGRDSFIQQVVVVIRYPDMSRRGVERGRARTEENKVHARRVDHHRKRHRV